MACSCCTSPSAILSQSSFVPTAPSRFAPLGLPKLSYSICSSSSSSGSGSGSGSRVTMSVAPAKQQNIAGLTALALTAAMVIPDIAEAAQPGVSPSLKNLLLSVIAGGTVLLVLAGAVAGVATFDPVKRI